MVLLHHLKHDFVFGLVWFFFLTDGAAFDPSWRPPVPRMLLLCLVWQDKETVAGVAVWTNGRVPVCCLSLSFVVEGHTVRPLSLPVSSLPCMPCGCDQQWRLDSVNAHHHSCCLVGTCPCFPKFCLCMLGCFWIKNKQYFSAYYQHHHHLDTYGSHGPPVKSQYYSHSLEYTTYLLSCDSLLLICQYLPHSYYRLWLEFSYIYVESLCVLVLDVL